MMSTDEKPTASTAENANSEVTSPLEAAAVVAPANPSDSVSPDKGFLNPLLVFSCLAFGAASFLFGYDDKVISPVAATAFFVSFPEQNHMLSTSSN
jgi:hypothetical protein